MRRITVLGIGILIFGGGCSQKHEDVGPTISLSDSNGSSRLVKCSTVEADGIIEKAFGELRYHQMLLVPVTNSDWDYLAPNWRPMDGYILYQSGPIGEVPLTTGGSAPYTASFSIDVQQIDEATNTKITVRTLQASIANGTEQGIHGGIVSHWGKIAPVRREEEAILDVIERQSSSPESKRPTVHHSTDHQGPAH